MDLTGKTIDQYQLIENIDSSGTTYVYKGFQPSMNRYVAVHELSPILVSDQTYVDQFQRQNELMAHCEHHSLLPVYDSGHKEGIYYRVSRYVENGDLSKQLSWFYDLQNAQTLIHYIVEGLEYLHNQGLVHGNLKSSNILLDKEHRPLMTNFGIPYREGVPTNVYMSPEQAQGVPVDKRTDVYALGVLLYELLVGEQPPVGIVVSPRVTRSDLPQEVEMVIFKAMAQNPDQRFQTVQEFANALDSALTPKFPEQVQALEQPITTSPITQTVPQPQKKSDTSWVVFLLGAVFVIVIITISLIFIPSIIGDQSATPAPTELAPIEPTQPISPTEPLPVEPTEEPPVAGQPTLESPDDGGGVSDLCPSTGFMIGIFVFGLVFTSGIRRKYRRLS